MSRSLEGRSVIVTGGGTGIGAACAELAAEEGARVTICGRTEQRLDDTARRIRAAGGDVTTVVADVTLEADVERLEVRAAEEFGGGLDGVVANAGGGGGLAPYHLQDTEEYVRILELNVLSTMLCVKHAVPHLARGGGSFVGMSSIAGHVTHPYMGAYPVAKAAIEHLMRNAADEYGQVHVRFNAVQPGFISTEVMEAVRPGSPVWESYVSQTPLGGVGDPQDVAHLVRFLLSDESRWITGQAIAVDGGHCLRRGPDYSSIVARLPGGDITGLAT